MYIKNALAVFEDAIKMCSVKIENGKIDYISDNPNPSGEGYDACGNILSPGFIDIHMHGIAGFDTIDGYYESINSMSEALLPHGITSFVPTLNSAPLRTARDIIEEISSAMDKGTSGAEILGINMEGPFIARSMAGSHDPRYIRVPDIADFELMAGKRIKYIKLINVAPEIENAKNFINYISHMNVGISIGHSAGTYDDLIRGMDAGITHSTHLYNAMTGFHHREPGIVGGIFDTGITTEIIADGIHVNSSAIRTALKLKGTDHIALVSDSTKACCLTDGVYKYGEQDVFVHMGEAKLKNGNLAGSIVPLDAALKNLNSCCSLKIQDLLKTVTSTPACIIKEDHRKGFIKEGFDADFTVLDEGLNVLHIIKDGRSIEVLHKI